MCAQTLTQPASAYHHRVGSMIVTTVNDGFNAAPMKDGFVRDVSAAQVGDALEAYFRPRDTLHITFTPVVLRTGGEVVLIDTGMADNGPPTAGQLRAGMVAAGIDPSEVTKVIISHFHGDHILGLRTKGQELCYPNAEVMVPEAEWAFWTDDAKKAQAPDAMKGTFDMVANVFAPLKDRLTHYKWDQELAPGITALDARGHTPGHTAFRFASGRDEMIFISDVTNHPALFMAHPDWSPAFDMDPEQALRTRARFLDMIATDRLTYGGYHVPFPAIGHLEKDGTGYRHVPIQWMASV